jgi:carboxyl-terminal processing protease
MRWTVRNRTMRLGLMAGVAAFALAVTVSMALKKLELRRLMAARQNLTQPDGDPLSDEKLIDSLLTDSILSIVQNYYVDVDRVANRNLVETAIAALDSHPRIVAGIDKAKGEAFVDVDGDRVTFAVGREPRYQDVLEALADIGKLLDEHSVVIAAGEAPEKSAPASVMLLNGILAELDAHSALLSPDAYKELRQGTEGAFGGLGVLVGIREHVLTVIKPLPRSPAQRAGIKRHDRILGIDGVSTYGYSLDDLVEYMRGDPGTDVHLSLLRDGGEAPAEMTLKREVIHVDSVSTREINQNGVNVLHLTIENFASRTSREVLGAIKRFRSKHNGEMHGLVLDMRANPGGLLDQAVQVADLFLQDGVIVTTKGRRQEVESAGSGFDEMDFPVAVLIDGDSASASEIVAGALQDHGRAVVIGQPSFGKGSVQTIFELPGERALKLTIARYYTPAGHSIQNVGIIPDVWLQPVYRDEANNNLFGAYRYKNERFLRNHLETTDGRLRDGPILPSRRAYYLMEEMEEGDERRVDRELEVAMRIIGRVHKTYPNKLPADSVRASHWLGLAGPALKQYTEALDQTTRQWLKQKFQVGWDGDAGVSDPNVELTVAGTAAREVAAGATLPIVWKLTNNEPRPVARLSVFVRSEVPGFETKEILIGGLAAGETREGKIELKIPADWTPGALLVRVGAAADAWPTRAATDLLLEVFPRAVAGLQASVALVDEKGGAAVGVLESREQAKLRVTLTNDGEVPAHDLAVRLFNLAGTQLKLTERDGTIKSIAPGETRTIDLPVVAAKTLYASELGVGLYVDSDDLRVPLRQRVTVRAEPNGVLSRMSNLMSH